MAQQEILADQVANATLTDLDIADSASIKEAKLAFHQSTGHDKGRGDYEGDFKDSPL